MKRIEIVANRSTQDEILDGLESAIPDFFYTLVPVVHGRGRQRRRLGTPTWPEENFLLISYLDDRDAEAAGEFVSSIKSKYPTEGIKFFVLAENPD